MKKDYINPVTSTLPYACQSVICTSPTFVNGTPDEKTALTPARNTLIYGPIF